MNQVDLSAFSFSLFSYLTKHAPGTNIVISPFSIAAVLVLAMAGATVDSVCLKELQNALHIKHHEQLPALVKELLSTTGGAITLTIANGIWSKHLKQSYIEMVKETHGAEAAEIPATYRPLNKFINEKTNGLIPSLFGNDPIDNLIVAVLVNVVHFKGSWTSKFDKNLTFPGEFTTLDGQKRDAFFMTATKRMNLATRVKILNGANVVQLDYGEPRKDEKTRRTLDADYMALFILPAEEGKESIDGVVQSLASMRNDETSSLKNVLWEMTSRHKVELVLPRFKMEYGPVSLVDGLKSLGVKEPFDGSGGFMEMTNDKDVHIDDVLHKAVIEVTEEGTEAAAVSGAKMRSRSIPPPPVPMRFDRPFVMIIFHRPTNTPVFVCQVNDPQFQF